MMWALDGVDSEGSDVAAVEKIQKLPLGDADVSPFEGKMVHVVSVLQRELSYFDVDSNPCSNLGF